MKYAYVPATTTWLPPDSNRFVSDGWSGPIEGQSLPEKAIVIDSDSVRTLDQFCAGLDLSEKPGRCHYAVQDYEMVLHRGEIIKAARCNCGGVKLLHADAREQCISRDVTSSFVPRQGENWWEY